MSIAGKKSFSQRAFDYLNYFIMGFVIVCVMYPVLNILSISLSDDTPVLTGSVTFYPRGINVSAYIKAFSNRFLFRSYANTVFVASLGCVASLVFTSLAAYPLAYCKFYGKRAISFLIMFTMWFGAGTIPTYMIVRNLQLIGSLFSLIVTSLVSAYNTIILRNYYESIPFSLVESAYLDGGNDFQVLVRIVTPSAKPALAIIALWSVVGHWNDFFAPLLYLTSPDQYTLQLVLRDIVLEASGTEIYGMTTMTDDGMSHSAISEQTRNAVIFLAMLPMLVLYPFLQKYFVQGMMLGAVKG